MVRFVPDVPASLPISMFAPPVVTAAPAYDPRNVHWPAFVSCCPARSPTAVFDPPPF